MTLEWRVTAQPLRPRYFTGPRGQYDAHQYAAGRPHLNPIIAWRHNHGPGTSPWYDLTDREPDTEDQAS